VPHAFLRKLREIADRTGALLVVDEVQSGSGRTGKMWAIEHSGVVPDLLISAKSLGAGMPISAVTGRAEIMDAPHVGGVGSTYGGTPWRRRRPSRPSGSWSPLASWTGPGP
jgi:4-aminobutyrate aminotransferase/(S)-3-amino-2-methylpropionate transaminase